MNSERLYITTVLRAALNPLGEREFRLLFLVR